MNRRTLTSRRNAAHTVAAGILTGLAGAAAVAIIAVGPVEGSADHPPAVEKDQCSQTQCGDGNHNQVLL
jgi:hypothetical protein